MDRKRLKNLIDQKMGEIYEGIEQYIATLAREQGVDDGEMGSDVEVEEDADGHLIDEEGNVYDPETYDMIGKVDTKTKKKVLFRNN